MKDPVYDLFKVLGANLASWMTTVATFTIHDLHLVVTMMAGLGSLGVSIVSIIWIRKQTKHLGQGKRGDRP